MTTLLLLYALFHVTCGVLAYGICFAHFQRAYPSIAEEQVWSDTCDAMLACVLGPFGLVALLACGFNDHGLLYRPSKR